MRNLKTRYLPAFACLALTTSTMAKAADNQLLADFEDKTYGKWTATGDAFGKGPARGTLPGQMHVDGFQGSGLVNSFLHGDDATGTLTSPSFKIQSKFITFLIGGGGWADETCMNLLVDGKIVRSATGPNTTAGGTEHLAPMAWDVADLIDRTATIVILDQRKGGWGHINVDHIVQTNDRGSIPIAPVPVAMLANASRTLPADKRWLLFPIRTGSKLRSVSLFVGDQKVGRYDMELADTEPEWWAPMDVSAWSNQPVKIEVNLLPENSKALDSIVTSDTVPTRDPLYQEALRPLIHFSAQRGWINDPNGLVYFNGEYHLFFQHNPYGYNWGNMHWGHATSKDLVHWQEHGEALLPDELGTMFSGSAVVDWKNTSGFGKGNQPPLVLFYTAAGNPTTQCMAYSLDGRTFTKYEGNPIIPQITDGNRDPKVFWHEPSRAWVLVVYVEKEGKQHTIHVFQSPNLKEWKLKSIIPGGIDGDKYLFECPDAFELPVDGDASNKKWVINAANSDYAIGTFDGSLFKAEVERLPDVRGRGFYAAQTFSDEPHGRRVQIGWCQAPSPGMPFNQLQSMPCELTLRSTPEGIRLHRTPVREMQSLRRGPNQASSIDQFQSELIELRAEIDPAKKQRLDFTVRGLPIRFDAERQLLKVHDIEVPAPLVRGKQNLIVYVDRTIVEVFASDGQIYVTLPWIFKDSERSVEWHGDNKPASLEIYALKSLWSSDASNK